MIYLILLPNLSLPIDLGLVVDPLDEKFVLKQTYQGSDEVGMQLESTFSIEGEGGRVYFSIDIDVREGDTNSERLNDNTTIWKKEIIVE